MDKETTYIISKLKEVEVLYPNLKFSFGVNKFMEYYNILIQDSEVYNSIEFKNFEGSLILDFIKSFDSNYSIFFTDDVNYFEVENLIYEYTPSFGENIISKSLNKFNSFNNIKDIEYMNDILNIEFSQNYVKTNQSLLDLFNIKLEKNSVQKIFKSHTPLNEKFLNKSSFLVVENEEYALAA